MAGRTERTGQGVLDLETAPLAPIEEDTLEHVLSQKPGRRTTRRQKVHEPEGGVSTTPEDGPDSNATHTVPQGGPVTFLGEPTRIETFALAPILLVRDGKVKLYNNPVYRTVHPTTTQRNGSTYEHDAGAQLISHAAKALRKKPNPASSSA